MEILNVPGLTLLFGGITVNVTTVIIFLTGRLPLVGEFLRVSTGLIRHWEATGSGYGGINEQGVVVRKGLANVESFLLDLFFSDFFLEVVSFLDDL